jgi:hypothetical protein
MTPVRLLLAAFVFLTLLSSSQLTPAGTASSITVLEGETWTVMAYMAADAYPELYWEPDINEMEAAGLPASVNVVALVDPLGSANTRIYEVAADPDYLDPQIVSTEMDDWGEVIIGGEVDTGDPDTLAAFVEWGTSNYPAERYALFLWGHGAGWAGLCPDGASILTLPELRLALETAESETGHGMDLLAVDACVEGTLETVYEIRGCADFLVASEKTVPGEGFPYDLILGDLGDDPDMTAEELGGTIVDRYVEWAFYGSDYCEAMTMFDLSQAEPFIAALDALARECIKFNGLFDEELYDALFDAESYEDPDSVDVGDLLSELMRADLPIELRYSALDAAFAYSGLIGRFDVMELSEPEDGITMEDATGMVAYVPGNSTYPSYGDLLVMDTLWPEMAGALWDDLSPIDPVEGPTVEPWDADGDGWLDALNASWPDDIPDISSVDIWAFGENYDGIDLEDHVAADGTNATMEGLHGLTLISASALDPSGMAISHEEATLALEWEVAVEVTVLTGEGASADGCVAYAVLEDGTEVAADGLEVTLGLPSQVNYGQMIRVELRDGDGSVVGWAFSVISSDHTVCEIVVLDDTGIADYGPSIDGTAITVIAWTLAAVAVAYAVRLWRRPG